VADEVPAKQIVAAHGRTLARLARQVELAAATVDLTLAQYRVMGILHEGREAASKLAEKLAVSRPSITGVVDGLVARGLVVRSQDGSDRRRIDVHLTDLGRTTLAQADAEVQRRLDEVAAHSDQPAAALFAGLEAWSRAFDAYRSARHAAR
jgi:long-chain acyl-CoA synthetase